MIFATSGHTPMDEFYRIKRLPPYVFTIVNDLKTKARARGEDIIDLGMGNPDLGTPKHIVAKLIEAAQNPKNHRYSASRGITRLRIAITKWYRDRYRVELDPESEAIATIGAKEGLAHLALAVLQPGDGALVPNPTYPIHSYSVVIADGDLRSVPLTLDGDFFARLEETAKLAWPKAKLLILSFPHNPTTMCVDRGFFEKVVAFAREHRLMVVHDFAYADFAFDGYRPPSSTGSTSSAGRWKSPRARCSSGRRFPSRSAPWARSSSPRCSSRKRRWPSRRASGSVSTARGTCGSRSSRTSSGSSRRFAGS